MTCFVSVPKSSRINSNVSWRSELVLSCVRALCPHLVVFARAQLVFPYEVVVSAIETLSQLNYFSSVFVRTRGRVTNRNGTITGRYRI